MKKYIFSYILKKADRIIVNSIKFKSELKKKLNINSESIYNPLNYKEIKKLSKQRIREKKLNRKYLNIINVGRLVDQKDQITLLKAINHIKNEIKINLLIIGEGKKKNILNEYIIKNNLLKLVKIKKHTTNPFPYIKSSDIFILSSIFEGLPNVLLEAISLKCFVISSDCPTGPSEILDKGKGGLLFRATKYRDLANKILFFISNKKACEKKLKFSHKRLHRFDYNLNLNKYLNVVNDLIR